MHADLIEGAARAKKAIFCEKPIDLDAERVARCLEVVRSTGATVDGRLQPALRPQLRRVAAAHRSTAHIGALEIVSITSRDPGPPPISYIARSGGLFRDMMIHDFDMARFLLGEEPVSISAMGSALVDKAIGEAGDVDTAVVDHADEIGQGGANFELASRGLRLRSAPRGAWLQGHAAGGQYPARRRSNSPTLTGFVSDKALNFFLERYAAAYRIELGAFIDAVKSGARPTPDGEDGLRANKLADAAYRSWKTGQRVALD